MALAVGSHSLTTAFVSDVADITATEPASWAEDELGVAITACHGDNDAPELATGWSSILRPTSTADAHGLFSQRIVRGASAPSLVFGVSGLGSNEQGLVTIVRFTGADTSSPVGNTGSNTGSSSSPLCPSISVSAGSIVLFAMAMNGARLSAEDGGYPSGTTGLFNKEDNSITCGVAWQAYASAGTTGTKDFSGNVNSAASWMAMSIEIKEAAAAAQNNAAALLALLGDL